jgi:hypothetical protein
MDDYTLTADEAKFFETGELPASLAPEPAPVEPAPTPAAVDPAPAPAAAAEPPAPAPNADVDLGLLRQRLADEQARNEATAAEVARLKAEIEAAKPKPQAPDLSTDPLGHLLHKLDSLNEKIEAMSTKSEEERNQSALKNSFEDFKTQVRGLKEQFAKTTPDFDKAHDHLRDLRRADLRDLGMDAKQIEMQIIREEVAGAEAAVRAGKNPAAELYAKAVRYGYQKPAPAAPTAEAKLAIVKAGLEANPQPLAREAPAGAELTFAALKDAGEADLDKVAADDNLWQKVVGGRVGGKSIF